MSPSQQLETSAPQDFAQPPSSAEIPTGAPSQDSSADLKPYAGPDFQRAPRSRGAFGLVKRLLHRGLLNLGYELRKRPTGHRWGVDPFVDQRELLRGVDVKTILDVGANIGQTTARYRCLFPEATIHAFEPTPDAFTAMAATYGGCPQVVLHQLAVTDRDGTHEFYLNQFNVTNSLLAIDPRSADFCDRAMAAPKDRTQVRGVRLDDFCREHRLDRIDLLKMDIQGGEGRALAGASELLTRQRIRMIFTEVLFAPLYEGQTSFSELTAELERHRYRLFGLYALQPTAAGLAWADAIYLPA